MSAQFSVIYYRIYFMFLAGVSPAFDCIRVARAT